MMDVKIPVADNNMLAEQESGFDDEEEEDDHNSSSPDGPTTGKTNSRPTSQSLPRSYCMHQSTVSNGSAVGTSCAARKVDSLPESLVNRTPTTPERKKRSTGQLLRSFGHFVQKVARQLTSVTLHGATSGGSSGGSRSRTPTRQGTTTSLTATLLSGSRSSGVSADPVTASDGLLTNGEKSSELNGSFPAGVIGIQNHGNTCFMNAVIQCLANTEPLARYLVTNRYRADIRRSSSRNSPLRPGSRGELTDSFATVVRSLWTRRITPEISNDFRSLVGRHAAQYRGCTQHDAQEFLLWLLDKIHEDVNIATKKKYRANKSNIGRPDEVVAAESLANHARCNNSFIYDLFQALYRSSLTCPSCRHRSNTFDPFLSLSLPIPHKSSRQVLVTVLRAPTENSSNINCTKTATVLPNCTNSNVSNRLSVDGNKAVLPSNSTQNWVENFATKGHSSDGVMPVSAETNTSSSGSNIAKTSIGVADPASPVLPHRTLMGFVLDTDDTVRELRRAVSDTAQTDMESLVLIDVDTDGVRRTLNDSQSLSELNESDDIYAIEVPQQCLEKNSLVALVLNKDTGTGLWFGPVMVVTLARDNSLSQMKQSVRDALVSFSVDKTKPTTDDLLRLRLDERILSADDEQPLQCNSVDSHFSRMSSSCGSPHVKLVAEWDKGVRESFVSNGTDAIVEHESVRLTCQSHQQPSLCTLDECFQVYMQDERLGVDDAWLCPNCHKYQQDAVKALSLWSLPEVLVLHLKRFKQDASQRFKLNTLVTFPTCDLDMSRHCQRKSASTAQSNGSTHQHHSLRDTGSRDSGLSTNGSSGSSIGRSSSSASTTVTSWLTWRPGRKAVDSPEEHVYDLYAVCNHYGNMQGGHYTAFCKNAVNGRWYSFNDNRATEMRPEEVVTRAAYILFYQRRSAASVTDGNTTQTRDWLQQLQVSTNCSIPRTATSHSLENILDSDKDGSTSTDKSASDLARRESGSYTALHTETDPVDHDETFDPSVTTSDTLLTVSDPSVRTSDPSVGMSVELSGQVEAVVRSSRDVSGLTTDLTETSIRPSQQILDKTFADPSVKLSDPSVKSADLVKHSVDPGQPVASCLVKSSDSVTPANPLNSLVRPSVARPSDPVKPDLAKSDSVKASVNTARPLSNNVTNTSDPITQSEPVNPLLGATPCSVSAVKPSVSPVKPPVSPVKPPVSPVKPPVSPVRPRANSFNKSPKQYDSTSYAAKPLVNPAEPFVNSSIKSPHSMKSDSDKPTSVTRSPVSVKPVVAAKPYAAKTSGQSVINTFRINNDGVGDHLAARPENQPITNCVSTRRQLCSSPQQKSKFSAGSSSTEVNISGKKSPVNGSCNALKTANCIVGGASQSTHSHPPS